MKYDAIWMILGEILLRTKALVKRPISETLFLLQVDPAFWSQEIFEFYL